MAKIIIELPDDCMKKAENGQLAVSTMRRAILKGKVLGQNITNGDVIKALFLNTKIHEGEHYAIWDVGTDNVSFWNNWWNAPYKGGNDGIQNKN